MKAQNPYSSHHEIGLTHVRHHGVRFSRTLLAWACFCFTTFVATLVLSLAIGFVLVSLLVIMDVEQITAEKIKPIYTTACGFILPLPVSLLCYWWSIHQIILKKG